MKRVPHMRKDHSIPSDKEQWWSHIVERLTETSARGHSKKIGRNDPSLVVAVRNSNDAVGWQSGGGLRSGYQRFILSRRFANDVAILARSIGMT